MSNKLNALQLANSHLKLDKESIKHIVFIYCPPKVGSTSLVSSIRLFGSEKFSVIHIHDETMLKVLANIHNITVNELIQYNHDIGKNVYVIDVYRSPIERKMSDYFENLAVYHFNNTEENISHYPIEKIIHRFNKLFPFM